MSSFLFSDGVVVVVGGGLKTALKCTGVKMKCFFFPLCPRFLLLSAASLLLLPLRRAVSPHTHLHPTPPPPHPTSLQPSAPPAPTWAQGSLEEVGSRGGGRQHDSALHQSWKQLADIRGNERGKREIEGRGKPDGCWQLPSKLKTTPPPSPTPTFAFCTVLCMRGRWGPVGSAGLGRVGIVSPPEGL